MIVEVASSLDSSRQQMLLIVCLLYLPPHSHSPIMQDDPWDIDGKEIHRQRQYEQCSYYRVEVPRCRYHLRCHYQYLNCVIEFQYDHYYQYHQNHHPVVLFHEMQ